MFELGFAEQIKHLRGRSAPIAGVGATPILARKTSGAELSTGQPKIAKSICYNECVVRESTFSWSVEKKLGQSATQPNKSNIA